MRPVVRLGTWFVVILVLLVAGAIVFVALYDWNRARPWIGERISAVIKRPFAIRGDLSVDWRRVEREDGTKGWIPWPHVTARELAVGQPDWKTTGEMAEVDEVAFAVSPWPLLKRTVKVPHVRVSGADVDLQRLSDGRNNWTFELDPSDDGPGWTMDLGSISLDRAHIVLDDAIERAKIDIELEPLGAPMSFEQILDEQKNEERAESAKAIGEAGAKRFRDDAAKQQTRRERDAVRGYEFAWRASGSFRGMPFTGRGRSGGLLAIRAPDDPFPIQARLQVGTTRIAFVGTLTDPAELAALDLRLWLSGKSMADLFPLTGVALPETPPFATEGHLTATLREKGSLYEYEDFTGRVGNSDLSGSATYIDREPRPLLVGALTSDLLQFSDLGPLVGADDGSDGGKAAPAPPAGKVLPVEAFETDRWSVMDADVDFAGKRVVQTKDLPVDDVHARILLENGRLQLVPLRFGLAGGRVQSRIALDGNAKPMNGHVDVTLSGLRLKEMFPDFAPMQTSFGEINGSIALGAKGNSIAALLGTATGEVKLLVNDGAISKSLLEMAGLNLANIVITRLFGDKDVAIHCAATHLVAKDGVMESQLFVLDTEDAIINVEGSVDFGEEALALDVRPHTRGLRILSLRSPLYVKGTFASPDVGVKKGPLIARGGGALVLGIFAAPAAALIPLIAPSHGEPDRCGELLEEMQGRARAGKPEAPPKPAVKAK